MSAGLCRNNDELTAFYDSISCSDRGFIEKQRSCCGHTHVLVFFRLPELQLTLAPLSSCSR